MIVIAAQLAKAEEHSYFNKVTNGNQNFEHYTIMYVIGY